MSLGFATAQSLVKNLKDVEIKKDSPGGKECIGVRAFTQLCDRSRGNVSVEIPKLLEETWQEKKSRSCYGNVAGEILEVARGNMAHIPKLREVITWRTYRVARGDV
jgi:hypothetical protein